MAAALAVQACAAKTAAEPSAPAVVVEPSAQTGSSSAEPSPRHGRTFHAIDQFAHEPAEAPSEGDLAQARSHMAAGVAFLSSGERLDYASAYVEFRKAYELSGSHHALLNLAICAQRTERFNEAEVYYERVLDEDEDMDPEMRDQVLRDLDVVRSKVRRRR